MIRLSSLDYGLAIAAVRFLESKLINQDDLLKLERCKSVDELALELRNINYDVVDISNISNFNLKLNDKFVKVVSEIKGFCPGYAPFNVVFFENDCFNLKVVLFSKKQQIAYKNFVLKPGNLSIGLIKSCVFENNFEALPKPFCDLAIKLNFIINSGYSNFEILNLFNKEIFKSKLSLCRSDDFLLERVKLEIDIYNCKMVLKALNLKFDEAILKNVLVVSGVVDSSLILKVFAEGFNSLNKLFKMSLGFDLNNMLNAPDQANKIFFEKILDFDFRMRNLPFSFVAILSYLNELQHEHIKLKEILTKLNFTGS